MISDTLKSLARHFDGWAKLGGIHLDAAACATLAATLDGSSEDVAQMEAGPVPPELRGNVVLLESARAERQMRAAGGDWGAA